jgi:hypothetical protein
MAPDHSKGSAPRDPAHYGKAFAAEEIVVPSRSPCHPQEQRHGQPDGEACREPIDGIESGGSSLFGIQSEGEGDQLG